MERYAVGIDPASATATVAGVGAGTTPTLAAVTAPPAVAPFAGGDAGAWLVALLAPVVAAHGGPPEYVVLAHAATVAPATVDAVRRASAAAGVGAHTVTRAEAAAAWFDDRASAPDGAVLGVVDAVSAAGEAVVVRRDGGWFRPVGAPVVAGPTGVDLDGFARAAAAAGRTPATLDAVLVIGAPEAVGPLGGLLGGGGPAPHIEAVPDGAVALGAALVGRAHLRAADASPPVPPIGAPLPFDPPRTPAGPPPGPAFGPPFAPLPVAPGAPGGARRGPLLLIAAVVAVLALVIVAVVFTNDDGDDDVAGPDTTEDDDGSTTTEVPGTTEVPATTDAVPDLDATVVVAGIDESPNWNPAHAEASAGASHVAAALFPAPFRVAHNGTYVEFGGQQSISASLAQSDPQIVVYNTGLRAWSDGVPITIDDFDYTWRMQRGDDPIATPFSTAGWEDIAAIEVNPRGSISVTFARPYAEWEHLFSPLLPAHALVDGAGFNEGLRTLDADTVTAGSFTVEEYVAGDRLVLVGDPDASDPPEFGALDLRFLDSTEAVSAFLAGEIDLAVIDDPSPPDLAEIIEGGEAEVLPASIYEHLTFNLANPLLAEPVVRQAFLAALDRDTVAAAAAAEEGLVTGRVDSRVSTPGRPDYVEGTSNAGADAARAALEGAGFVPGTDGIYARGGQRLSVRLDTTAIPRREAAVDAITALLDEAGIEVLPASSSSIEFFERVLPPDGAVPDFDVAMFAFASASGAADVSDIFGTGGVSNAGGFSSPTVDGLLATITAELDPEARSARLAELDAVLGQELPSIPLYGIGTTVLADESLDNVIGSGFADGVFWNVTDWSVTG